MTHRQDPRTRRGRESKAREAEKLFRATSPEAAALPPEEIRPTRAGRRALLDAQRMQGNEAAQKRADEILRRERDNEKEAERLRPRRQRPHKHRPVGLPVTDVVVVGRHAGILEVRLCPEGTPGAQTLMEQPAAYRVLNLVTPELARDAAGLRVAFDIDRNSVNIDPPFVAREIITAIQLAAAAARAVWIPIALELVHVALVHLHGKARGALDSYELNGRPPPPTTPESIYEALVAGCLQGVGLTPPSDVNEGTISWMLAHLAVGVPRGGGRTAKIGATKMWSVLAHEEKRARVSKSV